MKTVLFACVHNAGRSQMAAAWLDALADPTKVRALSAGTSPAAALHPEVVAVMAEVGVDLSRARPRLLDDDLARQADLLVTMGCGEACPVVPGLAREDWPLDDPKGQPLQRVRAIRDEVRARVEALIRREAWGKDELSVELRAARAEDLPAISALLVAAGLPLNGVADHLGRYRVAIHGARVVGVAGLELYGDVALLRSVAVHPGFRGAGLGARLVHQMLDDARALGVRELYLLTTTAASFFEQLGFEPWRRERLPPSLGASEELRGACASTATVLRRALPG